MKRLLLTFATTILALTVFAANEDMDSLTLVANGRTDSLAMERMFRYRSLHTADSSTYSTNVYVKFNYQTRQRNAALWLVPSMYAIAQGQRSFVSEQYCRYTFRDIDDYDIQQQAYCTTIPHNRSTMPTLLKFLTPQLYDETLYADHIISPFCRDNRTYYHYEMTEMDDNRVRIDFRPRFVSNTQLVRGQAIVDAATGRIDQAEINGEFDMIRFRTLTLQGTQGPQALLPRYIQTNIAFKFMGNHIDSQFEAVFNCPTTLPDSVNSKGDKALFDRIRPIALSAEERAIYEQNERSERSERSDGSERSDSTGRSEKKHNYMKEVMWDIIGANLIHSLKAKNDNGYIKLSPIINPQYFSFNKHKGFSYRLKLGAQYNFNPQMAADFKPWVGYNFKFHEFYYTLPLRFTYNRRLDAHADIMWKNDHHIRNNSVIDHIRRQYGDLPELEDKQLNLFDDNQLSLKNNIQPLSWLAIEAGLVYHWRKAVNPQAMRQFGEPDKYQSMAPMIGLKVRPWQKGPLFSIDYERGIKTKRTNTAYERWEADISMKHRMKRLQALNLRVGGGLYTRKKNNYFMDFANFRDNNLPEGWDDDWAGSFQLLSSRLYNSSDYYLRGNVSYESPLLAASMVPGIGRYVERECIYLSSLSIAHTRLYSELGYGFTCRYFSMGIFASFLGLEYQETGCKFTFELFRKW